MPRAQWLARWARILAAFAPWLHRLKKAASTHLVSSWLLLVASSGKIWLGKRPVLRSPCAIWSSSSLGTACPAPGFALTHLLVGGSVRRPCLTHPFVDEELCRKAANVQGSGTEALLLEIHHWMQQCPWGAPVVEAHWYCEECSQEILTSYSIRMVRRCPPRSYICRIDSR